MCFISLINIFVTPYMGVWIETKKSLRPVMIAIVTPYMGVWIETAAHGWSSKPRIVTPYMGVWIETKSTLKSKSY